MAFNLSTDIDVDTSDAETEKALDILALGVAKALEEAKHTHALLESKSEELELAKLKRDEQEAVERERIREEVLVPARAELNKLRAECEDAGVVQKFTQLEKLRSAESRSSRNSMRRRLT